ncbi:hypothetical protein Hdeb2414_s0001g00020781 [Helianthus debilis subsp. tardiflorus]
MENGRSDRLIGSLTYFLLRLSASSRMSCELYQGNELMGKEKIHISIVVIAHVDSG